MFPAVVVLESEVHLYKRPPLRAFRFPYQMHAGLVRSSIRLVRVAGNAGANDVFPRGRSSPVSWDHVIQIQVFAVELVAAILTGILVPLKNVVPCELNLFFGQAIEQHQQNHPWNTDTKRDRMHAFRMRLLLRKVVPFMEIERLERSVAIVHDHLGAAFEQERQGPFG